MGEPTRESIQWGLSALHQLVSLSDDWMFLRQRLPLEESQEECRKDSVGFAKYQRMLGSYLGCHQEGMECRDARRHALELLTSQQRSTGEFTCFTSLLCAIEAVDTEGLGCKAQEIRSELLGCKRASRIVTRHSHSPDWRRIDRVLQRGSSKPREHAFESAIDAARDIVTQVVVFRESVSQLPQLWWQLPFAELFKELYAERNQALVSLVRCENRQLLLEQISHECDWLFHEFASSPEPHSLDLLVENYRTTEPEIADGDYYAVTIKRAMADAAPVTDSKSNNPGGFEEELFSSLAAFAENRRGIVSPRAVAITGQQAAIPLKDNERLVLQHIERIWDEQPCELPPMPDQIDLPQTVTDLLRMGLLEEQSVETDFPMVPNAFIEQMEEVYCVWKASCGDGAINSERFVHLSDVPSVAAKYIEFPWRVTIAGRTAIHARDPEMVTTLNGDSIRRGEFTRDDHRPSEWAKICGFARGTFFNRMKSERAGEAWRIVKIRSGRYVVHLDDLPRRARGTSDARRQLLSHD